MSSLCVDSIFSNGIFLDFIFILNNPNITSKTTTLTATPEGEQPTPTTIGNSCCKNLEFHHYCLVGNQVEKGLKCMPLAGNGFLKSGPFTIAYHQNNENMKTLIDAKNNQVDLFLSWCWPAGITLNSDLALKDDIQESDQFTSGIVAELVAHLEPRYHFCAGNAPKYYEREPFKSQGKMTRFIGLGAAESGAKAMYALVLKPFDQEESKGISTTPSPFSSSQKRPRQEEEFHESSFFWNNDGASFKKAKANDVPPDGYICKICKNPGHYVHKCPENKTSLPEGYLCRICGTPGHHSIQLIDILKLTSF